MEERGEPNAELEPRRVEPDLDAMHQDESHRRRLGIVGTGTRQRAALDWTPLSLLHLGEGPHGTRLDLYPSPEPGTNWWRASAREPATFFEWDGMRERMCF